ncbi:hypothetical protein BT93_L2583 [Corymbia citriodora subsp. variegata]|uniref:F-box domain-containing protein n=1 Tax=Corymbia citriodora subsp. variegata TaxID=360336 RepID=A0A8T0CPJ6_CORYI|nr:hypothetical protein BT93_L2583 [Corymbia citriodora subsp. variegata]
MAGKRRRLIPPPEAAEEVDHISHLPDAIIHHIFSFLPFKDVVKTSLLCKQWRFFWTSTPYIDISLPSKGVVPSISRALNLCTATKIEKFHVDATMSDLYTNTELDQWLRFAMARKVEDVSLAFGHCYHFVPRILCKCKSLVSLRVSRCCFSREITIRWPALKKLCLEENFMDEDGIMKIWSGCRVLESLTLRYIIARNLRIESTSLRELVIDGLYISSLDISAPNLLSLGFSSRLVVKDFRLNGVSSLAAATCLTFLTS